MRTSYPDSVLVVGNYAFALDDSIQLGPRTVKNDWVKTNAVEETKTVGKFVDLVEYSATDLDDCKFCRVGGVGRGRKDTEITLDLPLGVALLDGIYRVAGCLDNLHHEPRWSCFLVLAFSKPLLPFCPLALLCIVVCWAWLLFWTGEEVPRQTRASCGSASEDWLAGPSRRHWYFLFYCRKLSWLHSPKKASNLFGIALMGPRDAWAY